LGCPGVFPSIQVIYEGRLVNWWFLNFCLKNEQIIAIFGQILMLGIKGVSGVPIVILALFDRFWHFFTNEC
jgi:hypothetical protein